MRSAYSRSYLAGRSCALTPPGRVHRWIWRTTAYPPERRCADCGKLNPNPGTPPASIYNRD
jgi:hypothetical protein